MRRPSGRSWMLFLAVVGVVLQVGGCPNPAPVEQMALTVQVTGHGHVYRDPEGGAYDTGTETTLLAVADDGWLFDHWEGALSGNTNPATLTMDADQAVQAVFVAPTVLTQTFIDTDTTIPAGIYDVNEDIIVRNNSTLTLADGVTLRFACGTGLYVMSNGALTAIAMPGRQIVLTGQMKVPGFWTGVRFLGSDAIENLLEEVTIEYAGGRYNNGEAALYVNGNAKLAVRYCTLRNSRSVGFQFADHPDITFDANTVTANKLGAGRIEPWHVGLLTTTSSYTGNTEDVLLVNGGATDVDGTWQNLGVPYVLAYGVWITRHTTLEAGVEIVSPSNGYIYVYGAGALTANGTAASPVVLTGQAKSPGSWQGLHFDASNSPDNSLTYVRIEYGGADYLGTNANVYLEGISQLALVSCAIENSLGWGIWKEALATLTQSGTTFAGNASGNEHP